jgi:predicted TIM-barrel fold metal-dependent hydrolase
MVREVRVEPDTSTFAKKLMRPKSAQTVETMIREKSIKDVLKEMDAAGVDKAVIVGIDVTTKHGIRVLNEDVASLAKQYPDRFIAFAGIDPRKGYVAIEELEKAVIELGMKGMKLVPPIQEFFISDMRFDPLWKKALDLDIPVWTHVGHQVSTIGSDARYGHPMLIEELALRHPDLKIIMGHCATPWFWEAWSLCTRHENVYLDNSAYWKLYPALMPVWKAFSDYGIEHKLLFATDYPLTPFDVGVKAVKDLPLSEEFKRKILGENAAKLLEI